MNLILFDIDGTLITSGGAGERSLQLAVRDLFGVEHGLHGIEIAGRTDTGIARQILARLGIPATPEALDELLQAYLAHLAVQLPLVQGALLPGIRALLDALQARPDVLLGLLTGNLRRGAELKLTHYGIWHYFPLGAFADDHHDRNELGRFAWTRANAAHGSPIAHEKIFVLGDTPHDIACGKAIGAKTVAVATGTPSKETLAQHHPDYLFTDFSDLPHVLAILEQP